MSEAYILGAVRSAVGKKNGGLSGTRPDEVAGLVLKALVDRTGVDPRQIEDVVMGCVTQVGEQGLNVARNAALIAGFPITVAGTTVNRLCGSSQQAVDFAAMAVMSGTHDLMIGAGIESMSRINMGSDMFYNGEPATPSSMMNERFTIVPQGISAEFMAKKWKLSRAALDEYSLGSHQKATAAQEKGYFDKEIAPLELKNADGKMVSITRDEGPRKDTNLAKLGSLKPAFQEDGVITAGSSSQISDGAAALLIGSAAKAKELGIKPRARIIAMSVAGVDPTLMLSGPIPATQKALAKAGLKMSDIDLVEINEAFASVVLAAGAELGFDWNKVNVNGGAIALGHPLGASGARLLTTLLHEMERRDVRYGLATMCIGFGQGITTIIDRHV